MKTYTPAKAAWKRMLKALLFAVLGSVIAAIIAQPGTFLPEQYQTPAITALVTAIFMGAQKWHAEARRADAEIALNDEDIPPANNAGDGEK